MLIRNVIRICFILLLFCALTGCQAPSEDRTETPSEAGKEKMPQDKTEDKGANSLASIPKNSPDPAGGGERRTSPDKKENRSDKTAPGSSADPPVDPSTLSNSLMAWWFMRNEDHMIPSAQEEIDLTAYDAFYVKSNLKEGEKPVFLTFDCGYENGFTPRILDVLKKHKAPAAFFVCKHFIKDQPDLIRRMKKEGHIVGNHTVNHICLPQADERTIRKEIADNASYMKETTGYDMDPFFRPPKGEYSERTLQIIKSMGYTTVFWSLAYVDYDVEKQPGAGYVIDHFNRYIHPGAIPLIHNISSSNAEALDTVLDNLEKEGYSFCSLEDLKKF